MKNLVAILAICFVYIQTDVNGEIDLHSIEIDEFNILPTNCTTIDECQEVYQSECFRDDHDANVGSCYIFDKEDRDNVTLRTLMEESRCVPTLMQCRSKWPVLCIQGRCGFLNEPLRLEDD
ncbi:uncharacterized protein LOC141900286 [Tubulanus polymorphus]|uniref:uncharacterized protein LOC141900286 n=1 Tax=Tubulanus polymorphus TaxID=672921 RepID=UPI003DA1C95F